MKYLTTIVSIAIVLLTASCASASQGRRPSLDQVRANVNLANYPSSDVIAHLGANNDEFDRHGFLAFDIATGNRPLILGEIPFWMDVQGGAWATTAYLYDGPNLIASASFVPGFRGWFEDIDLYIPSRSRKTLTVKVDLRDARVDPTAMRLWIESARMLDSSGSRISANGPVIGETFTVRRSGPAIRIVGGGIGRESVDRDGSQETVIAATFSLSITALGEDVYFDPQDLGTFKLKVLRNGVEAKEAIASAVAWDVPSSGVVTAGLKRAKFRLQQNNTVTVPVSFVFRSKDRNGEPLPPGGYSVRLESVSWTLSDGGPIQTTSSFGVPKAAASSEIYLP